MDPVRLKPEDRNRPQPGVIAEAAAALITGAIARLVVPFPRLARTLANSPASSPPATADEIEVVRRAIDAWTRRLPIKPKCFSRGLAAVEMLKRRGRSAHLYYGAATFDGRLKAHVWVKSGELDVVGCDIAEDYALLASFPSAEEGNSPQKW